MFRGRSDKLIIRFGFFNNFLIMKRIRFKQSNTVLNKRIQSAAIIVLKQNHVSFSWSEKQYNL